MEDKKDGKSEAANGRLKRRGRREMYWRAGCVGGGLDRHPTGLTAEFLLLVMFVVAENWLLFEGGCCLREVEVGDTCNDSIRSLYRVVRGGAQQSRAVLPPGLTLDGCAPPRTLLPGGPGIRPPSSKKRGGRGAPGGSLRAAPSLRLKKGKAFQHCFEKAEDSLTMWRFAKVCCHRFECLL